MDNGETLTETFTYTITDDEGGTSTATLTITIDGANDAPIAGGTIAAQSNDDADSVSAVDVAAAFSDVDGDVLTYTATGLPSGLTLDLNTGEITGTIDNSASQGGPASDGVYTVEVTATDDNGATVTTSFTWTVANPGPIATDNTGAVTEDTALTENGNVITEDNGFGVDADPDADDLMIDEVNGDAGLVGVVVNGTYGQITINDDGSYVYTLDNANADVSALDNGETLSDVFTYTVTDSEGGTSTATLTIAVNGTNDAPIVGGTIPAQSNDDADTIAAPIDVTSAFSDVDGDVLTYTATGLPSGLTLDLNTGEITGTINNSASQGGPASDGTYTVEVTAMDDNGETVSTTFTWTVANPGPVAMDDTDDATQSTTAGGNVITDAAGQDTDVDGDLLTVLEVNGMQTFVGAAVNGSDGGLFTINSDGSYGFSPNGEFDFLAVGETATTAVTYTITDSEGGTSTATLEITVTGENDAPTPAGSIPAQTNNDADAITTLDTTAFFEDVDASDTQTFAATGLPTGLSIDPATGEITGTIDNSASQGGPLNDGVYEVTVTADDGNGGTTDQTFTWTVANPGPIAVNDSNATGENNTTSGNVIVGSDSDPDNDMITVNEVAGLSSNIGTQVAGSNGGQFTINADGSYVFATNGEFEELAAGEFANSSITYTITDNEGGTATATLTVTIAGVNDTPATNGVLSNQANLDGDVVSPIDVSGFFSDIDGEVLEFSSVDLPNGLSIDPSTGIISGTIDNSASLDGPFNVIITATDPSGATVALAFDWEVTNPGPTATDNTGSVSTGGTATSTGNLISDDDGMGTDSDPDNDDLTVSEINGGTGTVDGVTSGSYGVITILSDGTYTYTLDTNNADVIGLSNADSLTESFTYTVTDGEGGTSTATLTITVNGTNDTPVVGGTIPPQSDFDAATIADLDVTSFFSDPDGDALTYTATGLPQGLTIDLNTGQITGMIDNSASQGGPASDGVYTVGITADDGFGESVSTTFTWTTTNPGPLATDNSGTVQEDTVATATGNVISNDDGAGTDSDPDGDDLTVGLFEGNQANVGVTIAGEYGEIVMNNDGSYTYTVDDTNAAVDGLDVTEQLTETFTYTVTDSEGGTSQASLTITIEGTNDAPISGGTIPSQASDDADSIVPVDVASVFSDPDGDTLTYTANGLPTGLTLDPITGQITGTVDNGASQGGPNSDGLYTVEVTATDDNGATVTATFEWAVTNPGPTAYDNASFVTEDTILSDIGNLITQDDGSGLDFDPDGDSIQVSSFVGSPSNIGIDVAGNYGSIVLQPNGLYTYTLDNNNPAVNALDVGETVTETFFYSIADGEGGGDFAKLIVTINGTNDAPINGSTITTQSSEDGQSIAPLDVTSAFSDPEGDTLTYTATGLPTGLTLDPNTGQITGAIDNSASQDGPSSDGIFSVEITATDDNGESVTTTFTWNVTNPAVVATDNTGSVTEDTDLTANGNVILDDDGSGVDSDPDGDDISVSAVDGVASNVGVSVAGDFGDIILNSNGTYTYSLDNTNPAVAGIANGITLTDNFTYTISDNEGGTSTANISIVINSTNDAPTASGIPAQTDSDSSTPSLDVSPFFSDVDDTFLTFAADGMPAGLSIDPLSGEITGTIDSSASQGGPNSDGVYTVEVIATDANGANVTTEFTWSVTNPAPTANTDSFTTNEDTTFNGAVASNDSDPDGDNVTFAVDGTGPANGTVTLNPDGTFSYTPNADFNGSDSFDYTITDADGATATTTVTINVTPVNDAPVVDTPTPDQANDDADPVNIDVSGNFSDTEGSLTFDATGLPPGLSIDSSGNITGTIDNSGSQGGPNSDGVYTVVITATDSQGETVTDTLTWTVSNPAPIAGDDTFNIDEDNPLIATVASDDSDPDGDAVTFNLLNNGPTNGTIQFNNDGTFSYTPGADFNGTDSFDYEIVDADGSTDTATVTISVQPTNDPPIVANPLADQLSNDSDTVTIDASEIFSDIDDERLTYTAGGLPTGLTIDPTTGVISGTIDSSASQGGPSSDGIYTVVVTADDGNGGTVTDTFTYAVSNVAPNAVADEFTTSEDTPFSGNVSTNDSDPDGDSNVFGTISKPDHGTLTWNPDGTFTYTPDSNFEGTDSFIYHATDVDGGVETAEVTIIVTAVNDVPVADDDSVTIDEDTSTTIDVLDNDTDPEMESLAVTIVSQPINGTVTVNPDGSVTYVPFDDFNGTDTFEYEVCDPSGACDTAVVTVLVTPVNDVPNAVDDEFVTLEDTPIMGNVATNDINPDGDTLTFELTSSPSEGTISFNDDGTFTYIPAENFNGPVTFEYEACDSTGLCDTATVTINVVSVNEGPVAVDDTASTDEDSCVVVNLLTNDTDEDRDTLNVIEVNGVTILPGETMSLPSGAKVTLQVDGTAKYDPNGQYEDLLSGQSAIDTFLYTISDGNGGTSIAEAVIMINGENDTPVANDDFVRTPLNTPITLDVLGNDYDPENQTLAVILLNQPVNGEAVVNPDGTITYTPATDVEGTVTLHYLVEDPNGATDDATVTIEVEPPFQFDTFTNFSKTNEILSGVEHRPSVAREVISQKIFTLAPEPIFSGYAAPGTQIIGRIYDASGSLVGESSANTDPGGNWMMQFHSAKGHDFYRIEFQQVSTGASDVYGYMGLNPSDNSYQSMEPMTCYDRPLSVEGAMQTSKEALDESHRANSNPMGFGRSDD
ncbi:MAG: Ig-like domain-containing protein [Mariniblastus sp.]